MDLSNAVVETSVDAGCSANLTLEGIPPGAVPVWLEVPDELARDFVVTDIKVGLDSQLCSTGAVPASLFARGASRDELLLDPVDQRGTVTVSVTNLSLARSVFVGKVVFSQHDTRLARYQRARVVGLGVSRLQPSGSLSVIVEPQRAVIPDRLFIPDHVLSRVEVEGLEIFNFDVARGHHDQLYQLPAERLSLDNLRRDGFVGSSATPVVGRQRCVVVKFQNKTCEVVTVTGAILGGENLSLRDD